MRKHAVRGFALVVAVAGFAAVSTAPAQPPAFLATTVDGTPLGWQGTAVAGATDDFQVLLETRVAELRDSTGLTAVAVAATIDGELAGAAVSGERRRDSGISVTVDDRWHMGSITKSMTATLLAVLEEDGLLSADDALTVLLPDVEMADGWSACTLDHLLTHTAGLAANFPDEFQDVWPETAEELVAERRRFLVDVLAEEPESPCGESFLYSNIGYTIAGHIAETIAGEPYEALIQNRVFAPLALMSAGFGPPNRRVPESGTGRTRRPAAWLHAHPDSHRSLRDACRQLPAHRTGRHGAHDNRRSGALWCDPPRRRVRDRPRPPIAAELAAAAHPVSGRLRPRLAPPRTRLGRRFPTLA